MSTGLCPSRLCEVQSPDPDDPERVLGAILVLRVWGETYTSFGSHRAGLGSCLHTSAHLSHCTSLDRTSSPIQRGPAVPASRGPCDQTRPPPTTPTLSSRSPPPAPGTAPSPLQTSFIASSPIMRKVSWGGSVTRPANARGGARILRTHPSNCRDSSGFQRWLPCSLQQAFPPPATHSPHLQSRSRLAQVTGGPEGSV